MYSGRHVHTPAVERTLHSAFAPQSDRIQGELVSIGIGNGMTLHATNGFPVYPVIQKQFGTWLITRHSALCPQESGQGCLHLCIYL